MNFKLDDVLQHYTLDQIRDYKERQEEVLFSRDYGSHWKDYFARKMEIDKLLKDIDINDEQIIRMDQACGLCEDRLSLFVTLRNIKTSATSKAIIDLITGSPTWEQFIDVTYDSGPNTDLKIIVYDTDDPRNPPKSAGCSLHAANLVEKSNRCGVKTFLIHATFSIKAEGKILNYLIDEGPRMHIFDSVFPILTPQQPEMLPTKRQVKEAEFWVGYNYDHWITRGFERLGYRFDASQPLEPGHWRR